MANDWSRQSYQHSTNIDEEDGNEIVLVQALNGAGNGNFQNAYAAPHHRDWRRAYSVPENRTNTARVNNPRREVCILGDEGVGKDIIFSKLTGQMIHGGTPVILNKIATEITIQSKKNGLVEHHTCSIAFSDLGRCQNKDLLKNSLSKCHLIVAIFSSDNEESFANIDNYWLTEKYLGKEAKSIPKIIMCHIRDRIEKRKIEDSAGQMIAQKHRAYYLNFHDDEQTIEECKKEIGKFAMSSKRPHNSGCSIM